MNNPLNRTQRPKSWDKNIDPVVTLESNFYGPPPQVFFGEDDYKTY